MFLRETKIILTCRFIKFERPIINFVFPPKRVFFFKKKEENSRELLKLWFSERTCYIVHHLEAKELSLFAMCFSDLIRLCFDFGVTPSYSTTYSVLQSFIFFRRVCKIAKETIAPSCLSARVEQRCPHWRDFHEILYLCFFLQNLSRKFMFNKI